jgi:phosphate transport system substrate-binding protein
MLGLLSLVLLAGCPGGAGPSSSGNAPVSATPAPAAGSTITQVGSTTILPIAQKWVDAYGKLHPDVKIAVSGGGSGAGIKALLGKSCDIADASRKIKPEEVAAGKAAGVNPVELKIAYDGIAVIVNPKNPLKEISVEKLSDMFSGTTKKWSDVGGSGGDIQLINRESSSGTYDCFNELVLTEKGKTKDRKFDPSALAQASNEAVLTTVAQTANAIGYVGLGYVNSTVKVLAVIPLGGGKAITPAVATVRDKSYPISRELYVYTNGDPVGALKTYLDWMISPEGQGLVKDAGYIPLTQ